VTTEQKLTRDAARALFADAGLGYDVLTRENLQRLRTLINERMRASRLINGTYRCRQRASLILKNGTPHWAALRCNAFYFYDREAVTFNPNGFLGFAGWAADDNVRPVLDGFADWVQELTAMRT
jgi:hypothetical protein